MRGRWGKSLVCQAEVWILLKSRDAEGDGKAQVSETSPAEKTPHLDSVGIPGGLACHPGGFAGATDPALPGPWVGTVATSALS